MLAGTPPGGGVAADGVVLAPLGAAGALSPIVGAGTSEPGAAELGEPVVAEPAPCVSPSAVPEAVLGVAVEGAGDVRLPSCSPSELMSLAQPTSVSTHNQSDHRFIASLLFGAPAQQRVCHRQAPAIIGFRAARLCQGVPPTSACR
jgi:hypothetical protein